MDNEQNNNPAKQIEQPIESFSDLQTFLAKIQDIRNMDDANKFRAVFLTCARFCDLCQADTNIVVNVAIDMLLSAMTVGMNDNIEEIKKALITEVFPEMLARLDLDKENDREQVDTGLNKLNLDAVVNTKPDGKLH